MSDQEYTCVKIMQIDDRSACSGVHLGGGRTRRKIVPGEVVPIPHKEKLKTRAGERVLLDALMETGKLTITREPPTRPFEFMDEREAQITAPTYKPQGDEEVAEVKIANERIRQTLLQQFAVEAVKQPSTLSVPTSAPPAAVSVPKSPPPVKAPSNRRNRGGKKAGE